MPLGSPAGGVRQPQPERHLGGGAGRPGLTVRTRIGMPGNLRPAGGLLPSPGSLAVSLQQTPRQEPHSAAVALLGELMTEALQGWVER